MSNKIKISKDNIARFMLDELLLYESYKNIKLNADKSAENIANEFNEFINRNNKNNNDAYEAMYHYAKSDVEYMLSLSTITNMYNTFEQFLKKMLNIKFNSHKSLNRLCNDFLEKYEYKYEENTYYEIIDKYRMLNNAIKHGSISDNIKKLYPELIDKNYNSKDVTILDGILNITEDEIIECFTGFVSFIDEMYEYFEIMGYLSK